VERSERNALRQYLLLCAAWSVRRRKRGRKGQVTANGEWKDGPKLDGTKPKGTNIYRKVYGSGID
jgi:hypothetical protein